MAENQEALLNLGLVLPLIEDFYTIQGEGFNTGKAAYFIRLGGCDIGCKWCDTKFSWKKDVHALSSIELIMTKIKQTVADSVVITGGEPTSYNLSPLTKLLKNNGLHTFIETSGAYNLTGDWDWICLSPKKQTPPMSDIYGIANELKVIIACEEDLNWAVENAEKVNKSCLLYLQPEWSKCQELIPLVVDFVKNNQNWQLSLQTHKFIHIP